MKSHEQVTFLQVLADTIIVSMADDILDGRVPEEWEGQELRQWLADRAKENGIGNFKLDKKRKAEYNNTRLVNNL